MVRLLMPTRGSAEPVACIVLDRAVFCNRFHLSHPYIRLLRQSTDIVSNGCVQQQIFATDVAEHLSRGGHIALHHCSILKQE